MYILARSCEIYTKSFSFSKLNKNNIKDIQYFYLNLLKAAENCPLFLTQTQQCGCHLCYGQDDSGAVINISLSLSFHVQFKVKEKSLNKIEHEQLSKTKFQFVQP
jgi:hypothetical protein